MSETQKQAQQIREQRQSIHGDPKHNAECTGMSWSALINEHFRTQLPPLPPHLVHLMMVAFKLGRAARPYPKNDNEDYVDGQNYLTFAEEAYRSIGDQYACDACKQPFIYKSGDGASNSGLCPACYLAGLEENAKGPKVQMEDLGEEQAGLDEHTPELTPQNCLCCGKLIYRRLGDLDPMHSICNACEIAGQKPKQLPQKREHQILTPAECRADKGDRHNEEYSYPICDGGLGYCKVCGRAESELDQDNGECPGTKLKGFGCDACGARQVQFGPCFRCGELTSRINENHPSHGPTNFEAQQAEAADVGHFSDFIAGLTGLLYGIHPEEASKDELERAWLWLRWKLPQITAFWDADRLNSWLVNFQPVEDLPEDQGHAQGLRNKFRDDTDMFMDRIRVKLKKACANKLSHHQFDEVWTKIIAHFA